MNDLENKIESLEEHIRIQNSVITALYELNEDREMAPWLRQYGKGILHNQKTLIYLKLRIKADKLEKQLEIKNGL
jgi:hypothetical protein